MSVRAGECLCECHSCEFGDEHHGPDGACQKEWLARYCPKCEGRRDDGWAESGERPCDCTDEEIGEKRAGRA